MLEVLERLGSIQITITDISWCSNIWLAKPGLGGLAGLEKFQARALGLMKPGLGPSLAWACGAWLSGLQGFRLGHAKHYSGLPANLQGEQT
jgi:hypothetical protein